MFKRLFVLSLLVMFVLFLGPDAFAAATKARTAGMQQGILTIAGIGDLSSGNTAEVDAHGNLAVVDRGGLTDSRQLGDAAAILSGAGVLDKIIFTPATAKDYILVYDALTATGTHVVDIQGATADNTVVYDLGIDIGTGISTAVFSDGGTSAGSHTEYTVVYSADLN